MSPQELKEQKLTAIYRALLVILARQPMNKISVSVLCNQAGVSRTYFYREFGNFEQVINKYQQRAILQYVRVLPHDYPIGLEAAMVRYFDYVADSADEQRLLINSGRTTTLIATFEAAFIHLAETNRLQNSFLILKHPYYVSLLSAGVINMSVRWLMTNGSESPRQLGHLVAQYLHTIG